MPRIRACAEDRSARATATLKAIYDESQRIIAQEVAAVEAKEKEILASGSFEHRFYRAQSDAAASNSTNDARKVTAEEVWHQGFDREYLFVAAEKKEVFKTQNEFLGIIEDQRREQSRLIKAKAESDQYRAWVAQGEQFSSPAPFIQPFAFAAFGPLVGAAYGGTQTGAMTGELYNACVKNQGDCSTAMVQFGVTVATHRALRGEPAVPPVAAPLSPKGGSAPAKVAAKVAQALDDAGVNRGISAGGRGDVGRPVPVITAPAPRDVPPPTPDPARPVMPAARKTLVAKQPPGVLARKLWQTS